MEEIFSWKNSQNFPASYMPVHHRGISLKGVKDIKQTCALVIHSSFHALIPNALTSATSFFKTESYSIENV